MLNRTSCADPNWLSVTKLPRSAELGKQSRRKSQVSSLGVLLAAPADE